MPLPWLVVITGASRGFGRYVAQAAARALSKHDSHFVLMSRSAVELSETAEIVRQSVNDSKVTVQCEAVDLGDLTTLEANINTLFSSLDANARRDVAMCPVCNLQIMSITFDAFVTKRRSYSRALLINNAGSLGELTPVDSISSLAKLQSVIDFNVTSAMWLTSQFVKHFAPIAPATNEPNVVVNVSSLAAVKPFETWGIYCAGKAARDMFTATLALEKSADNTWKTLNYSPGPLDTVMQEDIRTSTGCHAEHRATFKSMHTQGQLVHPAVSAEKCINIILQNQYTSGSHVDFYDDNAVQNDASGDPRKALSKTS
eukprot:9951-Heterococcus_DN1.PRE.2